MMGPKSMSRRGWSFDGLAAFLLLLALMACSTVVEVSGSDYEAEEEWTASYLGRQVRLSSDGTFFDAIEFPSPENRLPPRDSIFALTVSPDELCAYNGTFSLSWQVCLYVME